MVMTLTRFVKFETLEIRGPSAVTVVKLMIACNDLTVTNQALNDWKLEQRRSRLPRQGEACRYFIRAQIGHLNEALKVIAEIHEDERLTRLVSQCDRRTQEAFQKLQLYLPNGPRRARFEQLAGRIRNNLAFHYDESGKLIQKAIADRASRKQESSITRANTAHAWHFKIADDVVDSIVVRQIWNIPRGGDLGAESDRIADEVHEIFLLFLDFAGEFVWKYCEA